MTVGEAKVGTKQTSKYSWWSKNITFGPSARAIMYEHFEQELCAGVDLNTSMTNFNILLVTGKQKSASKLLRPVFKDIRNGVGIGEAFIGLLLFDESALLTSGSRSGDMLGAFVLLKERMDRKEDSASGPLLALLYPLLIITISLITWNEFGDQLHKMEATLLKGKKFTDWLGFIVGYATHAHIIIPTVCVFLFTTVSLFIRSLPRWTGPSRKTADKYWPYNVYREFSSLDLLIQYASLRKGGVNEINALEVIESHASAWLKEKTKAIRSALKGRGKANIGDAAISAGFNVPNLSHSQTIRSMNNTKDYGARLLKFALKKQEQLLKRFKRSVFIVFAIILITGFGMMLIQTIASTEIREQVRSARDNF